ncbi:uncharacterized protein KY384_006771 [Bacidia gigantensis]|uniref:uncharacterized protein n=1 Tax=Bacidia gigantensis TaxID=2732470 RepID=UPI001D041C1C|nr:uncharacterized protein KY384_006771 [Bacidia gigantensis]KAG8527855.1 hypothetical protein KY384_006771 [Bacidia gigantensis]
MKQTRASQGRPGPPHLQTSPSQQPPPQTTFSGSQQQAPQAPHDAYNYDPSPPSSEQFRRSSYQQPSTSAPASSGSGSNMITEQLPPQPVQPGMGQSQGQAPPTQQQPPPQQQEQASQSNDSPQFDIFEWYPKYQSCQRYFNAHAQHSGQVQAVAAFVNILLPFQRIGTGAPHSHSASTNPTTSSFTPIFTNPPPPSPSSAGPQPPHFTSISLIPYLRRLVVTGLDFPGVLHGFFGDDWASGVGPLHEQERRNYLFAAKSGGWASVKRDYDLLPLETVPFMRPLSSPVEQEVQAAEKAWSEWLALEDWMVGERAPEHLSGNRGDQGLHGVGGGGNGRMSGQEGAGPR